LFAALIAGEELGGEATLAHLRHPQGQRADPGGELAGLVPVAVALPLLGPFVALGVQLVAHLCLEHLVENRFEQVGELAIAGEEALQRLLI
jgi:hypothetical protein